MSMYEYGKSAGADTGAIKGDLGRTAFLAFGEAPAEHPDPVAEAAKLGIDVETYLEV